MQFVLAEKCISCTIPGARLIEQLEANIVAAKAPNPSREETITIADIQSINDARDAQLHT